MADSHADVVRPQLTLATDTSTTYDKNDIRLSATIMTRPTTMTAMTGRVIPEAKTTRRRKGQDATGFGLTAMTTTTRRVKGRGDTELGLTATTTATRRSTPLTDLDDQNGFQVQRSRVSI